MGQGVGDLEKVGQEIGVQRGSGEGGRENLLQLWGCF